MSPSSFWIEIKSFNPSIVNKTVPTPIGEGKSGLGTTKILGSVIFVGSWFSVICIKITSVRVLLALLV